MLDTQRKEARVYVRTPCFRQELADRRRLQLSKERTTVYTPEVADIPVPVQLLRHDRETCGLLQVETCRRDKIPCGEEVGEFGADVEVYSGEDFSEIAAYRLQIIHELTQRMQPIRIL